MRAIVAAFIVALSIFILDSADARRRFGHGNGGQSGPDHVFHRVEPINLPADAIAQGAPPEWANGAFLERHIEIDTFILGYNLRDVGYVVRTGADTQAYWPLTGEQLQVLQEIGAISSAAPSDQIPLFDYVRGYALWAAIAALVLFQLVVFILMRRRAAQVRAEIGDDFPAFLRLVLVNVAKADGDIDPAEINVIATVMKAVLGADQDLGAIRQAAEAPGAMKRNQLVAYLRVRGKYLNADQRALLVRAMVTLIAADGLWEAREKRALVDYVSALGVDKKEAPRLVEQLARG